MCCQASWVSPRSSPRVRLRRKYVCLSFRSLLNRTETYPNSCAAESQGASIMSSGPCQTGGWPPPGGELPGECRQECSLPLLPPPRLRSLLCLGLWAQGVLQANSRQLRWGWFLHASVSGLPNDLAPRLRLQRANVPLSLPCRDGGHERSPDWFSLRSSSFPAHLVPGACPEPDYGRWGGRWAGRWTGRGLGRGAVPPGHRRPPYWLGPPVRANPEAPPY